MASSLPFSAGVKSASRILLSGRNGGWGPSFPFTNGAGACYNERRPVGRRWGGESPGAVRTVAFPPAGRPERGPEGRLPSRKARDSWEIPPPRGA